MAATGGILMFTPLFALGMALIGGGTATATVANIAGSAVQASKLSAISELTRRLFAYSEESYLLQALHHIASLNQEQSPFAVSNSMQYIDALMGYYSKHPEQLARHSPDDACNALQEMVDGTVMYIRDGYAQGLSDAAFQAFQIGGSYPIQVQNGLPMSTLGVGMVLGISSLSCAWAGCYGAQQMAQMVTFFKETGVSLAPRFMAANHHHFIKGAGVAAIVAGLAIIVGGIIDIVESVKEKDALVQRTENIRADLCRLLDELSDTKAVGDDF